MATVSCKARKTNGSIYYKLMNSYTTSGTHSLSISTSGSYYIELYGGGGGVAMNTYKDTYMYGRYNVSAGGSGAYFRGLVTLEAGTYSVTVGAGGTDRKGSAGSAGAGGDTTLANYVTATGGKGGTVPSSSAPTTGGAGGSFLILNSDKVSGLVTIGYTGNFAQGGQPPSAASITNYPASFGGLSIYDNSISGYGAGAGRETSGAGTNTTYPAVAGAFFIYGSGTSSNYTLKINTENIFCFYNQGKYYSAQ